MKITNQVVENHGLKSDEYSLIKKLLANLIIEDYKVKKI